VAEAAGTSAAVRLIFGHFSSLWPRWPRTAL
jgi:hypothetical protein